MTQSTVPTDEIAARFRAAGVVPPDDRAAGAYANAQRLLALQHWLRQPRIAAAEPAHTFSLVQETER